LFLADAYDDVIVRQLILKKINGGRRKRDGGNEIAIAQNVVDFFDNIWPGNRDLNKKKFTATSSNPALCLPLFNFITISLTCLSSFSLCAQWRHKLYFWTRSMRSC